MCLLVPEPRLEVWSSADGDSLLRTFSESNEFELLPFGVCGLDTRLLQFELFDEVVMDCLRKILLMLLLVRKLPNVVFAAGDTVV